MNKPVSVGGKRPNSETHIFQNGHEVTQFVASYTQIHTTLLQGQTFHWWHEPFFFLTDRINKQPCPQSQWKHVCISITFLSFILEMDFEISLWRSENDLWLTYNQLQILQIFFHIFLVLWCEQTGAANPAKDI